MHKTKERIEEENRIARSVNIVSAGQMMGLSLKRIGNGACQYRDEYNHINVYPGTNSYFNYYENRGGSPIDLLVNEFDMSLIEAIKWLVDYSGQTLYNDETDLPISYKPKSFNDSFELPPQNDNNKRVYSYLTKTRMIAPEVVKKFFDLHTLYESSDYHNCIFVGKDKDGKARHGFIRGTLSYKVFKGDVIGSDKMYGFSYINKNSNKLIVFEAPIDMLSYISLFPEQDDNMVALGMLGTDPIETFMMEYPGIHKIILTLDVDEYGQKAMDDCVTRFSRKYTDCITVKNPFCADLIKSGVKDVNEYLVKMKTIESKLLNGQKTVGIR